MGNEGTKASYWSKQFAAWRASGLSRRVFCQREGLKVSTFDYWRGQLASASEVKALKAPLKASAIRLVAAQRIEAQTAGPIRLKSESGWELSCPASIEARWLGALLRELA